MPREKRKKHEKIECKRCGFEDHHVSKCFRTYTVEGKLCASREHERSTRFKREDAQDNSIPYPFGIWLPLNKTNVANIETYAGLYEIAIYKQKEDEKLVCYLGMSSLLSERVKDHLVGSRRFLGGSIRNSNICEV